MARFRESSHTVEKNTQHWATMDGPGCQIWIEEEPGASGKNNTSFYQRYVLPGFAVKGLRATGSKESYANALAAYAEAGNVRVVRGEWNEDFFNQLELFPMADHDDVPDSASKGFHVIMLVSKNNTARARVV